MTKIVELTNVQLLGVPPWKADRWIEVVWYVYVAFTFEEVLLFWMIKKVTKKLTGDENVAAV